MAGRRKFKKSYRKAKRSGKKWSRSKKKYQKGAKNLSRRPVKGHAIIKGVKSKLNNKPEIKYTETIYPSTVILANNVYFLFNLNGFQNDPVTTQPILFYNMPGQGIGEHDFIANQINSYYMQLNFNIHLEDAVYDAQDFFATFRVMILSPKQLVPTVGGVFPPVPGDMVTEIDKKQWNIQYDKVFTDYTGSRNDQVPMTTASKPHWFRIKIPCKATVNLTSISLPGPFVRNYFQFKKDLYVMIITNSNYYEVSEVYTRFVYRDP